MADQCLLDGHVQLPGRSGIPWVTNRGCEVRQGGAVRQLAEVIAGQDAALLQGFGQGVVADGPDRRLGHLEHGRATGPGVEGAPVAAHQVEGIGVEDAVHEAVLPHVEGQHFADEHEARAWPLAQLHHLLQPALHLEGALAHQRGCHEARGDRRQPALGELVHAIGPLGAGHVHLVQHGVAYGGDDEFPRGHGVQVGVLHGAVAAPPVGREGHRGRVGAEGVEEAEGREVPHALGAEGAGQRDGARGHAAAEQGVGFDGAEVCRQNDAMAHGFPNRTVLRPASVSCRNRMSPRL